VDTVFLDMLCSSCLEILKTFLLKLLFSSCSYNGLSCVFSSLVNPLNDGSRINVTQCLDFVFFFFF